MNNQQPTTTPKRSPWKDKNFYRGVLLTPLLGAAGFMLMVAVQPSPATSFLLQWVFWVALLLASIVLRIRYHRFGLGMMLGWTLFVLFPIVWIVVLGLSGNLMS